MKATIFLLFSKNKMGQIEANLLRGAERVLSSTDPAAVIAAVAALDVSEVIFLGKEGTVQCALPMSVPDVCALARQIDCKDEAEFVNGMYRSSVENSYCLPEPQATKEHAASSIETRNNLACSVGPRRIKPPVTYSVENINAFELIGGFQNAARKAGWTEDELRNVVIEATSSQYANLQRSLAMYYRKDTPRSKR